MSIDYIVGFFFGISIILLAVILYKKVGKRDANAYDERQKQGQFVAYRASFWTLFAAVFISGLAEELYGPWATPMVAAFASCIVSITVYACVCIAKDAYTPLNKNPLHYSLLFLAIALLNLAIGLINLYNANLPYGSVFSSGIINLMCSGALIIIDIVYTADTLIKRRIAKESSEEE